MKSDMWSCGVILYVLLCGYPPFKGQYREDIELEIDAGKVKMDSIEWDNISMPAKQLILQLLEKDPEKRITADEALQHPWIINMSELDRKDKNLNIKAIGTINSNESLKNFNAKLNLQHACIGFIVHQMSCNNETKELRKIFKEMDKSGEGKLSINELRDGYNKFFSKRSLFSLNDFEKIIVNFAKNNEDYIEYEDFLRATLSIDLILTENNLEMAFKFFDRDNKGFISQENLKNTLGLASKENDVIKSILAEVDENNDGEICFDEFKALMKKTVSKK